MCCGVSNGGSNAKLKADHTSRTLNLRIKPDDRWLIERAAQLTGKTKTEFVLEAARRAAEDALLDRTLFLVGPEAFDAFRARLDEPPHPNNKLRRALQTATPWE